VQWLDEPSPAAYAQARELWWSSVRWSRQANQVQVAASRRAGVAWQSYCTRGWHMVVEADVGCAATRLRRRHR
jgi:hypothetical protein